MKRFLLSLIGLVFLTASADAAQCFWIGGTGNWDNSNTASWASTTGGTTGTCAATGGIPKNSGDIATFDGNSGGGTVTVCGAASANCPTSSGLIDLGASGQIQSGAFTGTLDFATRNPNVSMGIFICSGSGSGRNYNLGSGTYTIQAGGTAWNCSTTTGMGTFNAGTSTIVMTFNSTGNVQTFAGGGLTYNALSLSAITVGNRISITGNNTFASIAVTAPINIEFNAGNTQTISSAFTFTGTSSNPIYVTSSSQVTRATINATTGSTLTWGALFGMTFTGSAVNATNSLNFGGNNMNGGSITAPSAGGSDGRIIGG